LPNRIGDFAKLFIEIFVHKFLMFEPVLTKFFVDFLDYFGLFSIQRPGVIYFCRYDPWHLNQKLAQKNQKID
jgi:hypothetical protein